MPDLPLQDNYGLGSQTEIEKDSEDAPKRAFPAWAEWGAVEEAREEQDRVSPSLLFADCGPPNIEDIFGPSRRRERERSPLKW